jgi:protein gp37
MAKNSRIEWTDHTFNPWWGCVKVSPACKHCYAEGLAKRFGKQVWGKGSERRFLSDANWAQPLAWNAAATGAGKRARVFCASMADVFEDRRDLDGERDKLWALIEATPWLDWLLLTKRPEAISQLAPWDQHWPDNVWLGVTVEDQKRALQRLPILCEIPAKVRFISAEPLLGPLSLELWLNRLDWVIAGGESGHNSRPTDPRWFNDLLAQCQSYNVAFHFKQWGDWGPIKGRAGKRLQWDFDDAGTLTRIGKKLAGRILEGRTWDEWPKPRAGLGLAGCSDQQTGDQVKQRQGKGGAA